MKKSYLHLLFLSVFSIAMLCASLSLHAFDLFNEPLGVKADFRVAYYSPSSSKVRKIYGDGWADYQVELSKDIWCDLRGYVGVSGFSQDGHSICQHDKTTIQLIPISFGLKYDFPIFNCTKLYIGGAACYSLLRIRDHSDYVHKHVNKNEWGGIVQSGISYKFWQCFELSIFADYYFQRFDFSKNSRISDSGYGSYYGRGGYVKRNNLNMNGYKVGGGLAFSF